MDEPHSASSAERAVEFGLIFIALAVVPILAFSLALILGSIWPPLAAIPLAVLAGGIIGSIVRLANRYYVLRHSKRPPDVS